MNIRLSAIISRICAVILAFLGFSCDKSDGDIPLMYGAPTGTWEIKGEVTDETAEPVPDATVKVTFPTVDSSKYSSAVAKTNEAGHYISTGDDGATETLKVVCIPSNPALEPDSTVVTLKYSGNNKNDFWNFGHATVTVDFKLKKKEP